MKKFLFFILLIVQVTNLIGQIQSSDTINKKDDSLSGPLMIYDGIVINSDEELYKIDVDEIYSVEVIKSDLDKYIEKYGDRAKNGVTFITSKKSQFLKVFMFLVLKSPELAYHLENGTFDLDNFILKLNGKKIFDNRLDCILEIESDKIKKVKIKKTKKSLNYNVLIVKYKK